MKFSMEKVEDFSPNKPGFFTLKNDGDSARVRILYESIADVDGYIVHRVKTRNGYAYVNCLRQNYDDPFDVCPLCASKDEDHKKTVTKFWVPMYNLDKNEVVLWERGKSFWNDVLYPLMVEKGSPFCGHVFIVERHGEAKSMDTTYDFIEDGVDDTVLDDFDSIPDAFGLAVQDRSFEELENFVRTCDFSGKEAAPELPIRRRGASADSGSDDIPPRRGVSRPTIA